MKNLSGVLIYVIIIRSLDFMIDTMNSMVPQRIKCLLGFHGDENLEIDFESPNLRCRVCGGIIVGE